MLGPGSFWSRELHRPKQRPGEIRRRATVSRIEHQRPDSSVFVNLAESIAGQLELHAISVDHVAHLAFSVDSRVRKAITGDDARTVALDSSQHQSGVNRRTIRVLGKSPRTWLRRGTDGAIQGLEVRVRIALVPEVGRRWRRG
jgi:hypothetical protein